jgi:hypothetical protein
MRPRFADLLACLTLLLLELACFSPLVTHPDHLIVDGDRPSLDFNLRDDPRVVGNDLTFLFLPHYGQVADRIWKHGVLPFWDASGFAGRPMVGNPQGGLFYPPVWLCWAARSPASFGWLTIGHLAAGAIGVFVLARAAGLGRWPATVAAGCFEASPYLLAQTFEGHYPHIWAACWYPWAFWAFLRRRAGERRGSWLLTPILALMFLAGHPQEWYYLVCALSLWTLHDALLAVRSREGRRAAGSLISWCGLVGLSIGLSAVELIPDLTAQLWTLRAGRHAAGPANRYHLHGLNLWQLLDPAALGGPADYFGHDNYWETVLSIGLVPLFLVVVALACHRDRDRWRVRGWLFLVTVALIFAAGRGLGLFTLLSGLVPGMSRFRVPSRSLFLANLGSAILAGLGVEALGRLAVSAEYWRWFDRRVRLGAVILFLGLAVFQAAAWLHDPGARKVQVLDEPVQFGRPALRNELSLAVRVELAAERVGRSAIFWFAIGGTLLVLTYGSRTHDGGRRLAALSLTALALVELVLHAQALVNVAPADRFLGPDPISTALARAESPGTGPFRIRTRDVLYSDLSAWSHGFEKINVNDSFQIRHAAELYSVLYPLLYVTYPVGPREVMGEAIARFRHDVRQAVLDRLGVAFLVSDHHEPEPAWPRVAIGSWRGRPFVIHRNPSAMPRAYVVPRAEIAADDAASTLSLFRFVSPREAVLMPSDPLGPEKAPRQPYTPASYDATDPDRLVIRVQTEAPGLLVVADTWMPGWSARVDGRATPILRGNHAQRVIPLNRPGRHEVLLRYEPPNFGLGLALTGFSSLVWVGTGIVLVPKAARKTALRSGRSGIDPDADFELESIPELAIANS